MRWASVIPAIVIGLFLGVTLRYAQTPMLPGINRCVANVAQMLAHRLRRWANIGPSCSSIPDSRLSYPGSKRESEEGVYEILSGRGRGSSSVKNHRSMLAFR